MPYINVFMPLMEFIPYVDNILTKNNGVIYIKKRNSEGLFCNVKIDTNNYKNQIERNREKNSVFFISSKAYENPNINFYDHSICQDIIEGVGGRETEDTIELIALRIISKNPEKETVKIFNAIRNKLKKDTAIGVGVKSKGYVYKNYFYQRAYVGKKTFKIDINNDKLPIMEVL